MIALYTSEDAVVNANKRNRQLFKMNEITILFSLRHTKRVAAVCHPHRQSHEAEKGGDFGFVAVIMMKKWIMYFEKSLIRRLHTLIQHEKEAPFRELYRQSLDQLERKYPEVSSSARKVYPWQTHFRTQSQSQ